MHNAALGVTPLALGSLFLPPRRLDWRQLVLGGIAIWGINQLAHDYSGRSFGQRFNARMQALTGSELPEGAQRTQELLRREREARARKDGAVVQEKKKKDERGTLEALWMGDQGDDWIEERRRREKEALRDGGSGYWGLISDQISEVWNSARKKEEAAQDAEVKAAAEAKEKEEEKNKKS